MKEQKRSQIIVLSIAGAVVIAVVLFLTMGKSEKSALPPPQETPAAEAPAAPSTP